MVEPLPQTYMSKDRNKNKIRDVSVRFRSWLNIHLPGPPFCSRSHWSHSLRLTAWTPGPSSACRPASPPQTWGAWSQLPPPLRCPVPPCHQREAAESGGPPCGHLPAHGHPDLSCVRDPYLCPSSSLPSLPCPLCPPLAPSALCPPSPLSALFPPSALSPPLPFTVLSPIHLASGTTDTLTFIIFSA